MTLPATTRRAGPFDGNDSTTIFPFTFKVFAAADMAWYLTGTDGVDTPLTLNSDYSVTLNSDQDADPGGSVTYPLSGSPLADGEKLTGIGALPYDQTTAIPGGGNFDPTVQNNTFDRIAMQLQQLAELSDRTVLSSVGSDADVALPAPEAGYILGWTAAGDALRNYGPADNAALTVALAADSGSTLINHEDRDTGSVIQSVEKILRHRIVDAFRFMSSAQIADIEAGTLTLDTSAALNAFFAAVRATRGRGRGRLNGGLYRCNTVLTPLTAGYLDIEGEGKNGSVLVSYAATGSLLKFDGVSLPLCALSRMGFQQNIATTGQLLEASGSFRLDLDNLFFNGAPGGTNLAAGLALLSGTSVYARGIDGVGFTTFGLKLLAGNDYFISNGTIQANGVVGRPLWVQDVTGGAVQITTMNFLEGANCLISNTNFATIIGSFFDSAQGAVSVSGCEQVYFDAGCEFANRVTSGSGNGGGVIFGNSKSCGVYNSMVINCSANGITINADTENIEIIGNNIDSNNTANTAGVVAGINVAGNAQAFKIIGNTIGNNTALWSGYQKYGIAVNVGTSDNYIISNNDLRNNDTAALSDSGTGTSAVVRDNQGYNPIGLAVVSPPATTVTYRAGHTPETIYLTGGTVSAVKVPDNAGSTVFSSTPCTLHLEPNETFSISYTVAPTMSKQRH